MKESRLKTLKSDFGSWVKDEASGLHVFDVTNQHVFVQASGYLKYVLAQDSPATVLFRGQSKLYKALEPTLYRGVTTQKQKSARDEALAAYLREAEGKILSSVPDYAKEPLLQHYGIRTKWIDVVDNIWIALWFACHKAHAVGRLGEYLHFEKQEPSENTYAYILMVQVATDKATPDKPSLFSGNGSELIDLRVAVPSIFIRPHAQHALLIKRAKGLDHKHVDYADFVAGVLRVRLRDALAWLGVGSLTSVHALFPPPTYDFGYRELLDRAPPGGDRMGSIHVVGA